jgi:hypothetical protein
MPDLVDVRLAGWRAGAKKEKEPTWGEGATTLTGAAGESQEKAVGVGWDREGARVGDVVEYPLPDHVRELEGGERTRGVGVLLSVNWDRLDADALPEHALDLCEVDPLTIDTEGEGGRVWMKDELEPRVYVK